MEKVKLVLNELEAETVEVLGKNGDKVLVRNRIPYAEKEAQAYEFAAGSLVIDDGITYMGFKKNLLERYLMVKYYTNIDVDDLKEEDDYRKLFDYLIYNELDAEILKVINEDYNGFVFPMAWDLVSAAQEVHEKKNSLGYKLNELFGFLFTGEDISEQIASAGELNEKMIDMFKALQERDANNARLKNGKAKVHSGGAVLNMAKK